MAGNRCHHAPMPSTAGPLPIDAVLGELTAALASNPNAVLVAPPGAGKTTRVPLVLKNAPWAESGRLIVLEPRRLAARAAARRMAESLGETVGQTVGLRVRMQSLVSRATRIEVVTEGVFVRMILDDPSLDGVAGVLFDEFHERSLDADVGLALALDAQGALREDLRLLVMSATLDGARVAGLLGNAAVVESTGRAFPVETRYFPVDPRGRLEDAVVRVIERALTTDLGSVLVFLPGQGEIRRTADLLAERVGNAGVDIAPLFGALDRTAQDLAIEPASRGRRKVVLATSIAETSLTIEGVRIVIDCGLARVPRYEPDLGLSRLETVKVSRAAADQRRGRAGRTEPGICYRLWEEPATRALEPFAKPEILSADVAGLVLDLAAWGARDPASLKWLDPPPRAAVTEARQLLTSLGALDAEGAITVAGRALRALALPPRLARMVIEAARLGEAAFGAELAAVLSERGLGGDAVDLADRVARLRRDNGPRAADGRRLARGWADQAARTVGRVGRDASTDAPSAGRLIALAFPDRIAKARGRPGEFLMVNGRAGAVEAHDPLSREAYIAVAEITGRASAARILGAAAISYDEIQAIAGPSIEALDTTAFDPATATLRTRRVRRLGALFLTDQPLAVPTGHDAAVVLAEGLAKVGVSRLPWSKSQLQWRDRVMFLRRSHDDASDNPWPDVSDAALAASAAEWLAPFLVGKSGLSSIGPGDLDAALAALLSWDLSRRLDAEAPTHFEAPTGSRIALDYAAAAESGNEPILAIRVQELYGLATHPAVAGGRVPLTLELLSPAHRPIQITRDLPGFWKGSWAAVKTQLKGRYPRHVWPDDPANAAPTTRAKPRGT